MSIKQLNASYLLPEDRILFRITTNDEAEYRFWLTRRVTLFILQAAQQLLIMKLEGHHEKQTAQAIAEFERAHIQENIEGQLTVPESVSTQAAYMPGNHFPLGSDVLLVMDVRCTILEDSFSMDFVLPGGVNMNLNLPLALLKMMCGLLDRLGAEAVWGRSLVEGEHPSSNHSSKIETTTKKIH